MTPTPPARRGRAINNQSEYTNMTGLPADQAKEFHEQFKITYTTFAGIAALAHLLVLAWKPWF
jgi:light-harvesting complex 1 beta chain